MDSPLGAEAALWRASEWTGAPLETVRRPIAGALVESSRTFPNYYHGNRLILDAPPAASSLIAWVARARPLFAWRRAAYPSTIVWFDALDAAPLLLPNGEACDVHVAFRAPVTTPDVAMPAGFSRSFAATDRDWAELTAAEEADKPQFGAYNAKMVRAHRARVEAGLGVWALVRDAEGTLAASAGLFERDGVARFASVLTVEPYRRRGVMRALLAALLRESRAPADRTVIVAEAGAAGDALYRALGCRPFGSPRAALL